MQYYQLTENIFFKREMWPAHNSHANTDFIWIFLSMYYNVWITRQNVLWSGISLNGSDCNKQ